MTMPPDRPWPADPARPDPPPTGSWSGLSPEAPIPRPQRPAPHWRPVQRPGAVTAAAVILYVGAGLAVLCCCGFTVRAGEAADGLSGPILVAGGFILFFAVLAAVLAYFVMEGRQWARIVTIVFCGLAIVVGGVRLLVDPLAAGLGGCVGILVNGIVIGLLSSLEAEHYFRRSE